jgi:hypothetical protein
VFVVFVIYMLCIEYSVLRKRVGVEERVASALNLAAGGSTAGSAVGGDKKWEYAVRDDAVACRAYDLPLVPERQGHAPDRRPVDCSGSGSQPWVRVDRDVARIVRKGATCEFQGDCVGFSKAPTFYFKSIEAAFTVIVTLVSRCI